MGAAIEGLREAVRDLERLGVEVDDLKEAFAAIASEGAQIAARLAPSRSGRLAGSIRGNRAKGKAVVTAGRATVPYAGAINYGWRRRGIRASGFMQRADAQLEPRSVGLLEDNLNRIIHDRGFD
jgi:hypothetical protein